MMVKIVAVAFTVTCLVARAALGYGPVECCPPCGYEVVVCCEPCGPADSMDGEPAPPPAPSGKETLPDPAAAGGGQAPGADVDHPSPRPLNVPEVTPPAAAEPSAPATGAGDPFAEPAEPAAETTPPAESPAAEEEPSRYGAPPAEAPAEPSTDDPYAELFPDDAGATESETPAAETAPAEEPAEDAATPPAEEEQAPAEEEPPTPGYDELFPPSSANDVLSAPGGLASTATRRWNNAQGELLLAGRITDLGADAVLVTGGDGGVRSLRYAELSNEDLGFLREQIVARRMQLAEQAGRDELLASEQR